MWNRRIFEGKDVLVIDGVISDLVLLNNDLTDGLIDGIADLSVSPPPSMGWHRRRKSQYIIVPQGYVDEIS